MSTTKTTLITGGASQTGLALARLLSATPGHDVVFASRSGRGIPDGFSSVKFDWHDPSTFETPFSNNSSPIHSVYILPPSGSDPDRIVIPFIDLCVQKGVKRFIFLNGSTSDITRPLEELIYKGFAKVHIYLDGLKKGNPNVEFFVVRPTWFIENFDRFFGTDIRSKDEFVTSIPTGRIPFVGVDDVAQVAYEAIIDEKNNVTEKIVGGPELLTYDEAAKVLSEALGRPITHKVVSHDEQGRLYARLGLGPEYVQSSRHAEAGGEEKWWRERDVNNKVQVHIGKVTVKEWAEKNSSLFNRSN
ncbi:ergot alkaloid biosynthetic protein A [Coprinopsis cinerea okayama7|uniref:Ergot alkaloid biosynthetic protein A n=1 Tax=Coprinopsis cinerea (strain Okayama-7 / 130 / ATCC MYA-4618 / FGSC 9003) TaxID=240176 RepID=A8P338_COPC7|nr:ergot alkaloid biosynthetic protein A [Coprinopsis cinerea okayama7\|eukprot:XP_001838465.1 ergot alkaloid biosynthetic protein A [Coprinopsis cinerea okayama7\